jgi:dihydrofolate synthase/folylpolyglutamate synthase
MNYQQSLNELYARLPMFSRIGAAAYKKDISNTVALCEALGNPHHHFKSIHIAGTNGKGSTSHMLAAIMQLNGYKTGLYTSPHLFAFGERIRIDGRMIDEQFVIDFTKKTRSICDKIQPSFFELTVAMAFSYFAEAKVDVAIIETGLGGRLDSTNIIRPELAIITNIGMDHMNLLGDTIEQIAFEKAGIIKPNINTVIGEYKETTAPVFTKKAAEVGSILTFAEDTFDIIKTNATDSTHTYQINHKLTSVENKISTDLLGDYQMKNLRTAMTAVQVLNENGWKLQQEKITAALNDVAGITGLRGRWEIWSRNPLTIIDVAHNKDGIEQMLKQLQKDYGQNNMHFILGFVNDKDLSGVLKLFPTDAKYYFTNAQIERALPSEALQEKANDVGLIGYAYSNVNEAWDAAKNNSADNDVIMICGSFFIIAELEKN